VFRRIARFADLPVHVIGQPCLTLGEIAQALEPPTSRVARAAANVACRAMNGRSSAPLRGHLNVGYAADSGPSSDDAIRRVVGLCCRWLINTSAAGIGR
jgi:hypothetical protein